MLADGKSFAEAEINDMVRACKILSGSLVLKTIALLVHTMDLFFLPSFFINGTVMALKD